MPPRPRNSHLLEQVKRGDQIEVWWPHDAQYYSGVVGTCLPSGRHRILYDDGEVEDLRLENEQWRFIGTAAQRVLASASTPPPLDVPSPEPNSDSSPIEINPPAQGGRLSASKPGSKTPSAEKRGRPKGQETHPSYPRKLKITRTKRPSTTGNDKPADSSKTVPTVVTSSAPKTTSGKVKKRQRPSSVTSPFEKSKLTKTTFPPQNPPPLDVDSALIDAAPLDISAVNNVSAFPPSATVRKPSNAPVPPATARSVNDGERFDVVQRKTSTSHRELEPVVSASPGLSVASPTAFKGSSVRGDFCPTAPIRKCPSPASLSDNPALASGGLADHRSTRKKNSSASLGVSGTTKRGKVATSPTGSQQLLEVTERGKAAAKPFKTDGTPKKSTSTSVLTADKLPSDYPSESHHPSASDPIPVLPMKADAPKLTSSDNSLQIKSRSTNCHTPPNHPPRKTPMGLSVGDNDTERTSKKNQKEGGTAPNVEESTLAPLKFPHASIQDGLTRNKLVKGDSSRKQSTPAPQIAQGVRAENDPSAKDIATQPRSAITLTASVADNAESRNPVSGASDRSPSSRPDASCPDPPFVNSKGTSSPRTGIDSIARRGSRPKAGTKGSLKSKGGSMGKIPAVRRSISKPAKSVVRRHTTGSLPPRLRKESNHDRTAVNPDDGSRIVANVSVPRKGKGGSVSPLLRSPLDGRVPLVLPGAPGPMSAGVGLKPMTQMELRNSSLQRTAPNVPVKGSRSPLEEGERSDSKDGAFHSTKRPSDIRQQYAISREEQCSATDSHSRNTYARVPHRSSTHEREERSRPLSKPSLSDTQHKTLVTPGLPQNATVLANQVTENTAQHSSIWDGRPELEVLDPIQVSSKENQTKSKSIALEKSALTSPAQQRSAAKNTQTVNWPQSSVSQVEDLVTKPTLMEEPVFAKSANVHQTRCTTSRVERRHGSIAGNEGVDIGASRSLTALRTRAKAGTKEKDSGVIKRTASELAKKGKRRKLDSSVNDELTQVAEETAFATTNDSNPYVSKTIRQPSFSSHKQSVLKKSDESQQQQRSDKQKTLGDEAPVLKTCQAHRSASGAATDDRGERRGDEGREKPENPSIETSGTRQFPSSVLSPLKSTKLNDSDVRADTGCSGRILGEPLEGSVMKNADKLRVVQSMPSGVITNKITTSITAPQFQSHAKPDAPCDRGAAIALVTSPQSSAISPCVEAAVQAPSSATVDGSTKQIGKSHESQDVRKLSGSLSTNVAPIMSKEIPSPGVKDCTPDARESQPSNVAPQSFARVGSRQVTGSIPHDTNSKATASVTPDPNKDIGDLPLDVLMQTNTEPSKKSLQARLVSLSNRFEKYFTDNDRLFRGLQSQLDKANKTMELLREDLAGLRAAVSSIPGIAEIKTLIESHAQETRQITMNEMNTITSEVSKDLCNYLKSEIASAMENVAAQVQRDSVMLISKAIDKAISSGLLQDHPHVAECTRKEQHDEHGNEEAVQIRKNNVNSDADLPTYAGTNSDDIPLSHRFGLQSNARKDNPSRLSELEPIPALEGGIQSQPGEPERKSNGSSTKPVSHDTNVDPAELDPFSSKRSGVVDSSSLRQQHRGSAARVVGDSIAGLRYSNRVNSAGNMVRKEISSVTPAVSQNAQKVNTQSKGHFAASTPTSNDPNPETSSQQGAKLRVTVHNLGPQNSGRPGSSQNETPKLREEESGLGRSGQSDVVKNPSAPRISEPPSSPKCSEPQPRFPVNQNRQDKASFVDERGHQNKKTTQNQRRARRDSYKQLTHQMRILLARCAVEWFLNGGCRDFAPSNERETPVTDLWVKKSVLRCLKGIVKRLKSEKTFGEAMRDLAESIGPGIQTDWLLLGPTAANIDQARENYAEWDPQLQDFEWESEKRVLANLSGELISSEQNLEESGEIFEDPMYTAVRCVRHARERNSSKSAKVGVE